MHFFSRKPKPASLPMQEIQGVLIAKLTTALQPHGFKRSGTTFYRTNNKLHYIINLQGSRWNDASEVQYFVNVAIAYAPLYEIEYGDPAPAIPKEYNAQLRTRVTPDTWKFSPSINNESLCDTLVESTLAQALPFFAQATTPLELAQSITASRSDANIPHAGYVSRAIIFSLEGHQEEAQTELDAYIKMNVQLRESADPIGKMIKRSLLCKAEKMGLQLHFPDLEGETCVGFYIATKGKEPVHDERRTYNKVDLYLRNLEKQGLGYIHYYGSLRKPGSKRIAFCTTDPAAVVSYIQARQDKLPNPLHAIIPNDAF